MNLHNLFKFRSACKPADAITKQDLLNMERRFATALESMENRLNMTLDELLDDVKEERTIANSLIVLTTGIKAKLDAALAGALTPEQQAKVDGVFSEVEAGKKELADAIAANTLPSVPVGTPPTPA